MRFSLSSYPPGTAVLKNKNLLSKKKWVLGGQKSILAFVSKYADDVDDNLQLYFSCFSDPIGNFTMLVGELEYYCQQCRKGGY